jgi:5-histidylcysteine sulfoxide synthase/putative 4-mercaptohistidine N1-methyltranferase
METITIKAPVLTGTDVKAKKKALKAYFKQTWSEYESLFSLINDDSAYYLRPEPLRHPLIFYFGHTASFYINKLILGKYITERINGKIEAICAVGVDEMSWDDLSNEHYDWPSVNEVRHYRDQVATCIENLIDEMDLLLPITKDSLAWIILMGCEHERIHIETSSGIMRMLPLQYLTENKNWQACTNSGNAPKNELVSIAGKLIEFGKPSSDKTYGWDNEYGNNTLNLDSFSVSKYLVSNQEYLEFVKAEGYLQPEFWTEEGKQWLHFTKATKPHFWVEKVSGANEKSYWQRNLLTEIPLPLNWPVEVNYLEAKAFCQWKNSQVCESEEQHIRLLTEAEWLCLREKVNGDLMSWEKAPGNINREYYASSCPVDQFEHDGVFDVIGNVWQWTESPIDGFEGFEVHPLYDDFSTPTFDGKHNLIKGGSWISTGNEAQKHSRYAFRRHFFQHAGFRYVQSHNTELSNLEANHYEADVDICQQLHSQYTMNTNLSINLNFHIESYSKQVTDQVLLMVEKYKTLTNNLLDLGCSVGKSSFTLAQHFKHVDGVDFSARYIRHGVNLQQGKTVRYCLEKEGEIVDYYELNLKNIGLSCGENIQFSQGDISNLKNIFEGYDIILAQHVLEQSYDPRKFLQSVHQRLQKQGLLIIVSTYDFDEKQTVKSNWLGGLKINGENVSGFEGVSELLRPHFNLIDQQELTRIVQVNQRNFRLSCPQLSVWQLK